MQLNIKLIPIAILLPFVAFLFLCSCESRSERIARFAKERAVAEQERADARASEAKWSAIGGFLFWGAVLTVVGRISFKCYEHYSTSNVTQRLIMKSKDFDKALALQLSTNDYGAIHNTVNNLAFPGIVQESLVGASSNLMNICHLCTNPRNTYIPAGVRQSVVQSAHQTYNRLFQWISRVDLLRESHFTQGNQEIFKGAADDIGEVKAQLDKCLADAAQAILHRPQNAAAATVQEMSGILNGLREADRLLA